MDAVVTVPGAEPWSAFGPGDRGRVGVVITHGFTSSPLATRPLGQRLASVGYSVEVPLLPGHGTDHRDLARTRYRDWYDHLARVTDHLTERCERVILVGHSLGGTLSLDLASREPQRIAGVVTINAPITDRQGPLARLAPALQFVVPYLPRNLAGMPADDIARRGVEEGAYPMVSARAARSLLRELPRIRAQLLDLTQPLLVVRSTVDHTVPPTDADELLSLVGSGHCRELVCERSYHVVMLDHDAPLLEDAILGFLAEVTGR